ncbi:unnamed protein product, partial [Amoebophrya sp. A25]
TGYRDGGYDPYLVTDDEIDLLASDLDLQLPEVDELLLENRKKNKRKSAKRKSKKIMKITRTKTPSDQGVTTKGVNEQDSPREKIRREEATEDAEDLRELVGIGELEDELKNLSCVRETKCQA